MMPVMTQINKTPGTWVSLQGRKGKASQRMRTKAIWERMKVPTMMWCYLLPRPAVIEIMTHQIQMQRATWILATNIHPWKLNLNYLLMAFNVYWYDMV